MFSRRFTGRVSKGNRISATGENKKIHQLRGLSSIKAVFPAFIRQNSMGIEIGVVERDPPLETALVRITDVLVNGDTIGDPPEPTAQRNELVTYKVALYDGSPVKLPSRVNLDETEWTPTYGRPTRQTGVMIYPARVNDFAYLILADGAAALWVMTEVLRFRDCPAQPQPGQSALRSQLIEGGRMAFQNSFSETVDLAAVNPSQPFDVRLFDYVALSGLISDSTLSAAWGTTLKVQTSPDLRVWKDSGSSINKDDFVVVDVTQAVGWVRVIPSAAVAGKKIEIKWSGKSNRSCTVPTQADPSGAQKGTLIGPGGVPLDGSGGGGGGGSGGAPDSIGIGSTTSL